jgi:PPK2 family polyphosphate:nucleotide phosphotransferase
MASEFERHLIQPGAKVRLADHDPSETREWTKKTARARLDEVKARLHVLHEMLHANGKHGLLVVLQGMDACGKDGVIKHVADAFNHIACYAAPFKVPTKVELAHDFLWRVHAVTPGRGQVAFFNRSHYEDVLVVRVESLVPEAVWRQRYEAINDFERLLMRNGVMVVKFYLHISSEEQRERMEDRLRTPEDHYKFRVGDFATRAKWDEYMTAYEQALRRCSTAEAPWYLIPADKKWYRNLAIAQILLDRLERLGMSWPPLEEEAQGMTAIAPLG